MDSDPSQIAALGPSLESLMALLRERKRKILETFETDSVQAAAGRVSRRGRQIDHAAETAPASNSTGQSRISKSAN